jgi:hypothetical protein
MQIAEFRSEIRNLQSASCNHLALRTFCTATAALPTAAAAPTTAAIRFAAFFMRATRRFRCCFFTASLMLLAAESVKSEAALVALDAMRVAFFAAFSNRVFIRTSKSRGMAFPM